MYFDMPITLRSFAAAAVLASTAVHAQTDLVGTWTTKSRKVVTGPVRRRAILSMNIDTTLIIMRWTYANVTSIQGFYDPVGERMFEPDLTGFSYSFTADGHYEEAYYRAIANRKSPRTLSSILSPITLSLFRSPPSINPPLKLKLPISSQHRTHPAPKA